MADAIAQVRDLTHRYPEVTALDGLVLDVFPGVTGLVGANGAGKTTFLRVLLGLVRPTAGQVRVMGYNTFSDPVAVRSLVGYMPEGRCLPPDQTAADFVAYTAELAGVPPKDARRRASEVLFLVGLDEERFRMLGTFSTGMAQRVKLAQAIVHGPKLVLLDEPASGLDPAGRSEMLELVRRLGSFGINVIISSHILSDIEETCTNVVMLDGGKLVRVAAVGGRRSKGVLNLEVLGEIAPVAEALKKAGYDSTTSVEDILTLKGADDKALDIIRDTAALSGLGIVRLTSESFSLEEEFLESARGNGNA